MITGATNHRINTNVGYVELNNLIRAVLDDKMRTEMPLLPHQMLRHPQNAEWRKELTMMELHIWAVRLFGRIDFTCIKISMYMLFKDIIK